MVTFSMQSGNTKHAAVDDFAHFMRTARYGDVFVYAVGHLAYEVYWSKWLRCRSGAVPELEQLQQAVYAANQAKRVALTQRRIAPNKWEYRATRIGNAPRFYAPLVARPVAG